MTLPYSLNRFGGAKYKPYYCEVEYLESSGTQYIDTGYKPVGTETEYVIVYETPTNKQCSLFGACETDDSQWTGIPYYTPATPPNNRLALADNSNQNIIVESANKKYKYTLTVNDQNNTWEIKHTDLSTGEVENPSGSYTGSYVKNYNIFLFGNNKGGVVVQRISGRIHKYSIKQDGVLVRDFIPVLDWDMIPCMYDRVSDQLFYNQGTGSFTYGREIHYVDYLESTGTQYINTGFNPNNNTYIKVDFQGINTIASTVELPYGCGNYWGGKASGGNWRMYVNNTLSSTLIDTITQESYNGEKHSVGIDKNIGFFDSSTAELPSSAYQTTIPIYLFASNNNGTVAFQSTIKMFRALIKDNNVLIRDYYPAVDENGIGFMFDRVEHKIYDNLGTGAFKYPDIKLEYLESTASQVIDTGVAIESDVDFDMDVQVLEAYSGYVPMGAYVNGAILLYQLYVNTQNQGLRMVSNGSNTIMTTVADSLNRHKIQIYYSSMKYSIDGSDLSSIAGSFVDSTLTYTIFGRRTANGYDCYAKLRVYSLKMDKAGSTVRDYKPILRNGVAGLLDTANDVFYTNLGTGTFLFKIKERK